MEKSGSLIDLHSRLLVVGDVTLPASAQVQLAIEVAGVRLGFVFDPQWGTKTQSLCEDYWQGFRTSLEAGDFDEVILLSPAKPEYLSKLHPIWNSEAPFLVRHPESEKEWILHRDFTCLKRGQINQAWMPEQTEDFTDSLDNLVSFQVSRWAQSRGSYLFHSAVVEHRGEAVVFFGPSGIGKSTLAKLSSQLGLRVMASDSVYLRLQQSTHADRAVESLFASASPNRNPDIPRVPAQWVTETLKVKAMLALKRTGQLELLEIPSSEFARRAFAEIFVEPHTNDSALALKFISQILGVENLKRMSLSYPKGVNFWPELENRALV